MESLGYLLISGASQPSWLPGIQTCLCLNMHYIPKGKQINEYSHSIYSPGLRMHYSYICCRALWRQDQHAFSRKLKWISVKPRWENFGKFTRLQDLVEKLKSDMRHGWTCDMKYFKRVRRCVAKQLYIYIYIYDIKVWSLFPSFPSQSYLLSELMLY